MDHSDFTQGIHIQQTQIDVRDLHHIKIPSLPTF